MSNKIEYLNNRISTIQKIESDHNWNRKIILQNFRTHVTNTKNHSQSIKLKIKPYICISIYRTEREKRIEYLQKHKKFNATRKRLGLPPKPHAKWYLRYINNE